MRACSLRPVAGNFLIFDHIDRHVRLPKSPQKAFHVKDDGPELDTLNLFLLVYMKMQKVFM